MRIIQRPASLYYFGKEPSRLTDYECTMLAGLPQAPSVYQHDAQRAEECREKAVALMLERDYLTPTQAQA